MKIAYWLMPQERDCHRQQRSSRVFYQSLINQLAETYDAPKFAAHVTIYANSHDSIDVRSSIRSAIAGIQPFCLTIDQISYTAEFTRTLFVQFQEHPVLTQLCDRFRAQSPSDFVLNPHLSLIYGSLQLPQQQQLARELSLPGNEVWFDGVSAIAYESSCDRQSIEQFQLLDHQLLE